jgi:hypothetical protein
MGYSIWCLIEICVVSKTSACSKYTRNSNHFPENGKGKNLIAGRYGLIEMSFLYQA